MHLLALHLLESETHDAPVCVSFDNTDWEGGTYFVSPGGEWVVCDVGDHKDFAHHYFGVTLSDLLDKGWVRVVTRRDDEVLYWQGNRLTNIQHRTLKDAARFAGLSLQRDRAAITEGARLFVGTCVGLPAEELDAYDDSAQTIEFDEFARLVGDEVIDELNTNASPPIQDDWAVSFSKGRWCGEDAVCMMHSGIHHIWLI